MACHEARLASKDTYMKTHIFKCAKFLRAATSAPQAYASEAP